jgi:LPS export ABC transporter protein LptC
MNHKEIERWYRLRSIKKASQVLMVVAVVLLAAGFIVSKMLRPASEDFQTSGADSGITGKNFTFSMPGAHPWELKASLAKVSDALDSVVLTDPSMLYHGGKGAEILLTAKSGTLDKKTKTVFAQGDVRIKFQDFTFSSEDIDYSHEKLVAQTSSRVSLEGNDLSLSGKGMRMSVDSEEIVIEDDVKALLYNVKWADSGSKLPL